VNSPPSDSAAARERIRAAYSPELIGALGHRVADVLREHFARVESSAGNVLNWAPPSASIPLAGSCLDHARPPLAAGRPLDLDAFTEHFTARVRAILDHGNNLHDPRYIGHQVPASVPIAALFDVIGSATNQVMAIYEMGPWATAVERALIARVGETIGLPRGEFAGLITHGGSLANLTALLTARNVALDKSWRSGVQRDGPPPVLVTHADVHYGITRSAGILGLGTSQVVRAEIDDRRRIDPRKLDELLGRLEAEGHPIVAVAACACATPIGAFDPLHEIADVCEKVGVWLHVDAAHGGAAAFSAKYRHLVDGLARADSFICDAHKMLFVPALCAFVFYKNPAHRFETFQQDAPYLFDPSAPGMAEYDSGLMTIECTKRAAAYGLWGLWSLFGPQLFEDMVDVTFDLGRVFYEKLRAAPDFVPLHEPECNIVAFRYVPEPLRDADPATVGRFNREIRRRLIESGEFYIVQTNLDGAGALRVTIINPLTTEEHLEGLMEAIRRTGRSLDPRSAPVTGGQ
jgi:L-2,4-diaminobutyrate decarboxylase